MVFRNGISDGPREVTKSTLHLLYSAIVDSSNASPPIWQYTDMKRWRCMTEPCPRTRESINERLLPLNTNGRPRNWDFRGLHCWRFPWCFRIPDAAPVSQLDVVGFLLLKIFLTFRVGPTLHAWVTKWWWLEVVQKIKVKNFQLHRVQLPSVNYFWEVPCRHSIASR
jgi:hypothetical protein